MKRDPSIEQLLRGDLLAVSPLNYSDGRDEMLEALLDLLPAYTQRHLTDPGVALLEALAAVLETFGFYHDRILTESKVGAAQLLRSVALLGDVVGYTPRPALAAVTHQFFEARTLGVIAAGSKLAARVPGASAKVIFETLHALPIGPAFNRMAFDPIIARHVGAMRAVIRRISESVREHVTPLDEFPPGALVLFNGMTGLELTPISGARTRAVAVSRALRRSYGLLDTHIHCATEFRRLRTGQPLSNDPSERGTREDLIVLEVTSRPILHVPQANAPRLRSSLEVYVFDREAPDPDMWPAEQLWQEVPDFSASEAADRHYRTFVDDRLHTYIIVRRSLGYRELLTDEQLDHIYVRFTPAVGDIRNELLRVGPAKPSPHLVELDRDYFLSPIVVPRVDGEPVHVCASNWVVTGRSLDLIPGRQIIIENSDTGEKYVRTLGPRTLGQYLSWRLVWKRKKWAVWLHQAVPRPLWDRIAAAIEAIPRNWLEGLLLQTFGHNFPLALPPPAQPPVDKEGFEPQPTVSYPVLPGLGAAHGIAKELLFVEDIFQRQAPIDGWTERAALSISPLRDAAKAGPYHLWDQFYRHFENLDWRLLATEKTLQKFLAKKPEFDPNEDIELEEDNAPEPKPEPDTDSTLKFEALKAAWSIDIAGKATRSVVVVPRGATFIIVQDSSLIGPGDYFLLGKRLRYHYDPSDKNDVVTPEELGMGPEAEDGMKLAKLMSFSPQFGVPVPKPAPAGDQPPVESFEPHWMIAEVLQAVEVHGRIVRLKWPTQNQYDVDFQMVGGDTETAPEDTPISQPVTELIIVPQVASVFFGETFSQEVNLSPSRVKLANKQPPPAKAFNLVKIEKPRFLREDLRSATGWTNLKDNTAHFETNWKDMFLANFVGGEQWPVKTGPVPPNTHALVWHGYVFLRRGVAVHLAFSRIARADTISQSNLDSAPSVSSTGATKLEAPNFVAYDVGPAGLIELFQPYDGDSDGNRLWAIADDSAVYHKSEDYKIVEDDEYEYSADPTLPYGNILRAGTLVRVTDDENIEKYGVIDEGSAENRFIIKIGGVPIAGRAYIQIVAVEATTEHLAHLQLDPSGMTQAEKEDPPVFIRGSLFVNPKPSAEKFVGAARYPYPVLRVEHYEVVKDQVLDEVLSDLKDLVKETYYTAYPNLANQLDKDRYATVGVDSLADRKNFFYKSGKVKHLMVVVNSTIGDGAFALFSKAGGPAIGVKGELGEKVEIKLQLLADSIIFNSGNFIPVRLGGENEYDHKIVANSLRIKLDVINASFDIEHKDVEYSQDLVEALANSIDDVNDELGEKNLFNFGKTPEGVFTLNFLFSGYFPTTVNSAKIIVDVIYTAEPYHGDKPEDEQLGESEEPEDPDDPDEPADPPLPKEDRYVHVARYAICPDTEVAWREARFYQFETRPLPWNPMRQLVILNSGELKAGDYLFIDPSGVAVEHDGPCKETPPPVLDIDADEVAQARDFIQWTRVVEVDGRLVMVDPHVKLQPRGFYHYRVTGYRRPATATEPDEDYYALLESEKQAESPSETDIEDVASGPEIVKLSFRERLMLKPFDLVEPKDDTSLRPFDRTWLLDHLVPGDRLLVWDERWRVAWQAYRAGGSDADTLHRWWAWPDYQHEVVIKRIVPHLGIVDIERRMPLRFGVEYDKNDLSPAYKTLDSVRSFSALTFYREPFQGVRTLLALGDGDRRIKFARFTSNVDAKLGLGSVALDDPGTVASNIEVLTFEASAGEWTRWTEFKDIDRAKRKDRAFVLGIDVSLVDQGKCVDQLFPEEAATETEEQCCCPGVDRLDGPLFDESVPLGDLEAKRLKLSVSFGDGVKGDLLPTGKGNVFIRPVEIGAWCSHFLVPLLRRIVSFSRACMPLRIDAGLASAMNLVIVCEHGAHLQWQPREDDSIWNSSVIVEIDVKVDHDFDKKTAKIPVPELVALAGRHPNPARDKVWLREVTDDQAREGRDGFVLRPVRPGVVELSIVLPFDLVALFTSLEGLTAEDIATYVRVYEVPRVEQWRLDENFYKTVLASDPSLSAGAGTILLAESEGLAERSLLAFSRSDEESADIEIGEVLAVDHSTYSATLTRGLERVYDLERSYLFGNVVHAVQGNSDRLVLGSGDGATPTLRLGLGNREPILYSTMQEGAVGELTPCVIVLVDDIAWSRVASLEGRGPRERVYRLDIEASGKAFVCFGDGQSGAIPAAGLDNIVAVLRTGDGSRGNVLVGAVDRLLDGNLAVERTRNVTPGGGGKAADDVDQAREHLMTRSFIQGRVVTQDDVLRAVLALGNVVQARLDPSSSVDALRVIVALADRQPADKFVLEELQARLQAVTPVSAGCSIVLVDVVQRPVNVVLDVTVNRGFFEGDVILGLERAFSVAEDGFFDLRRWPIGAPLRVGEIYEQAFTQPGVATARVRWLSTDVAPLDLPSKVPDILWPEPCEVIRCDSDRVDDPYRARGSFRVQLKRGGK